MFEGFGFDEDTSMYHRVITHNDIYDMIYTDKMVGLGMTLDLITAVYHIIHHGEGASNSIRKPKFYNGSSVKTVSRAKLDLYNFNTGHVYNYHAFLTGAGTGLLSSCSITLQTYSNHDKLYQVLLGSGCKYERCEDTYHHYEVDRDTVFELLMCDKTDKNIILENIRVIISNIVNNKDIGTSIDVFATPEEIRVLTERFINLLEEFKPSLISKESFTDDIVIKYRDLICVILQFRG